MTGLKTILASREVTKGGKITGIEIESNCWSNICFVFQLSDWGQVCGQQHWHSLTGLYFRPFVNPSCHCYIIETLVSILCLYYSTDPLTPLPGPWGWTPGTPWSWGTPSWRWWGRWWDPGWRSETSPALRDWGDRVLSSYSPLIHWAVLQQVLQDIFILNERQCQLKSRI